ncbi:hypothetical protein SAMN05192544_10791 [Paraburkholderia hospita]|nr:hypothetical protein SAMN05192544_10791 [Paraburkholderia hospita]
MIACKQSASMLTLAHSVRNGSRDWSTRTRQMTGQVPNLARLIWVMRAWRSVLLRWLADSRAVRKVHFLNRSSRPN